MKENMSSIEATGNKTSTKFPGIQQNNSTAITPYAIALYSFKGKFDDELTFEANDIVLLIQHIDDNWIKGEIDGKIGIFPANYVSIEVDCPFNGFEAKAETFGKSSFDNHSVSNHPCINHLHTLKEPSMNTFVADWSVFETTPGQPTNPWPVGSLSNDYPDTAHTKTRESSRAQRHIKTSERLNTNVENSSDIEHAFRKRQVFKSFSFPCDLTDNESKPGQKSFVLKQKQAPEPPKRPRAAPIPSTIPLLSVTANVSDFPDRPVLLPRPQPSVNYLSSKSHTDKLFGNLQSEAFRTFESLDRDVQITNTTNILQGDDGQLAPGAMSTENTNALLGVYPHTKTEKVQTEYKEKVNKLPGAAVHKAPKPSPRKCLDENKVTLTAEKDAFVPTPAPRKSILKTKAKEVREYNVISEPSINQHKNVIDQSHFAKEEEFVPEASAPVPFAIFDNDKIIAEFLSSQNKSKPIPSIVANVDKNKSSQNKEQFSKRNLLHSPMQWSEDDKCTPKPPVQTDNLEVMTTKANTKGTEIEKQVSYKPNTLESSENYYAEIYAEFSDSHYAVIEPDSMENYYSAIQTLNMRHTTEKKSQDKNRISDEHSFKISPPPLSKRNKYLSKLKKTATKTKNFDITSDLAPSKTGISPARGKSGWFQASTVTEVSDEASTHKANNCHLNQIKQGVTNRQESQNVYEIMWPTKPASDSPTNSPPPLPPKTRQLKTTFSL